MDDVKSNKLLTRGGIVIEDIKVGDIHYEFSGPFGIECRVSSKPELDNDGNWIWESVNVRTNNKIKYFINPDYVHYSANLYDNIAYNVKTWI